MTTRVTHPSSLELEALACGETRAVAAAHVATCDSCQAHVTALSDLARPVALDADTLIARALAKASEEERVPNETIALRPARPASARGRLWLVTSSVIVPLAAAAAVLFLVKSPPPPNERVDHIQHAPQPPRPNGDLAAPPETPEPDTTFKGAVQLAVVRDREGDQARFLASSTIPVRTGDRLRIEVALDREQAILGGVLADDGSYLELMPLAVRGPGTHLSEKSAKIDPSPTHGTIVVGPPDAIARVRLSKRIEDVPGLVTIRVDSEAP